MQRMVGADVTRDRRMRALQERSADGRIVNVDVAAVAGQRPAGAASAQIATAFAGVVALAGQLLARDLLFWNLAAEAGDERERAAARGNACIDDAGQEPVEGKDERDNVTDDSVTKLETRLHAAIRSHAARAALIGINRLGQVPDRTSALELRPIYWDAVWKTWSALKCPGGVVSNWLIVRCGTDTFC